MKNNQKGFGVIEILAVIAVLLLLGAVGWWAYVRQTSKTDDKNTTAQTNQQTTMQNTQDAAEDAKQPIYFEIKELGVKFELNQNLSGLYYTLGNEGKTVYFSLNELRDTDCAADKTAQVALTRYSDADFDNDPMISKEQTRKIGSYYYYNMGGQAACSEDEKTQERASQLRSDIAKLLPDALIAL